MHEEESIKRFIACKRRNVAAAYDRFLGPSAGALPEPWHSRTWAGLVHALRRRRNMPADAQPAEESAG
jgi:hypothetical protein